MNNPIDVVVTWLNSSEAQWQEDFIRYKTEELKNEQQELTNSQAFGPERFRDWGLFKFWWRCLDNSCPWINKVFLVVRDKNHVPTWLNQSHPKLRVVTHDEFIPQEFLPTFSGLLIEMFISRIPDLSENFIISDDDYYFLNPVPENTFFEDNIPITTIQKRAPRVAKPDGPVWFNILENDDKFLSKVIGEPIAFMHPHLFEARKKSFELDILDKYKDEIYNSFRSSRFRHRNNLMEWIYCDLMRAQGISINRPIYKRSLFLNINEKVTFDLLLKTKNCEMLCLNDSEAMSQEDFKRVRDQIYMFFYMKYPKKCSFEC